MSVVQDVLTFYYRPRLVARKRLAETAGEGHALLYLMLACLLFFVAQIPEIVRLDLLTESQNPFNGIAAGRLVGAVAFAPLMFYLVSVFAALAFRAADRTLGWLDSRIALFWALLVISPAMLVLGMLRGLTQSGGIIIPASALVGVLFVFFWAVGLTEAVSVRHGSEDRAGPARATLKADSIWLQ